MILIASVKREGVMLLFDLQCIHDRRQHAAGHLLRQHAGFISLGEFFPNVAASLADLRQYLAGYPFAEAVGDGARRHRIAAAEDKSVEARLRDDGEILLTTRGVH